MKLNKVAPSTRVKKDIPYAESNWLEKGDRKRQVSGELDGKRHNERIYKTPEFKSALKGISNQFQSAIKKKAK